VQTEGVAVTWQTGVSETSRQRFATTGKLANSSDTNYRPISSDVTTALAMDLGNMTRTTSPLVLALGLVRDPVMTYTKSGGIPQNRSSLWITRWANAGDAVSIPIFASGMVYF